MVCGTWAVLVTPPGDFSIPFWFAWQRTNADTAAQNLSDPRKPMQDDILNGWKEIGSYLHISEKNARRWELTDKLPILRPEGRKKGPVLARKSSLDAWLQGALIRVTLDGNRLVGFGRAERIIWTYEFPMSLRQFTPDDFEWRLQRILVAENDRGVLVTVRFVTTDQPDCMYCFSSKGKLQWSFVPNPPLLDRGGHSFERAWMFKHVLITSDSGKATIWAALANDAGWAGCILRIDDQGNALLKLANAGHVEWMSLLATASERFLVTCGENNAFEQSFVTILELADTPCGSPPGGQFPRYRYADASIETPRKYILFPRTELIAARQKPYGHAYRIRTYPDDLIVEVETGSDGGYFLYHFNYSLDPKYVFPSGSHQFRHRDLQAAGRLDHDWTNCPELAKPLVLNVWQSGIGWHDVLIGWRDNP